MRISDWSSDVCSSDLEPEHLTDADREAIRQLAQNIPALWSAASTTPRDRQTIARMLLERVEVLVLGETEHAELTCHWSGGVVTKHAFIRPVRRFEQLEHFDKLLARITHLRTNGATAQSIADILNTEGRAPPKKDGCNAPMINCTPQRCGPARTSPTWSRHVTRKPAIQLTLQEHAA